MNTFTINFALMALFVSGILAFKYAVEMGWV
jgi:hypothetical protein